MRGNFGIALLKNYSNNCSDDCGTYISFPSGVCNLKRIIFNGMENVISNVVTFSSRQSLEREKADQERVSLLL